MANKPILEHFFNMYRIEKKFFRQKFLEIWENTKMKVIFKFKNSHLMTWDPNSRVSIFLDGGSGGSVVVNKPIVYYFFPEYRIEKKIFCEKFLKLWDISKMNAGFKIKKNYHEAWDQHSRVSISRYSGSVWVNKPIVYYFFPEYQSEKKIICEKFLKLWDIIKVDSGFKIKNSYHKAWDPYSRDSIYWYGGSVWANKPIVNYLFSVYRLVKKFFFIRILKLRDMDSANVCLKIQNIYLKCWDPYSRDSIYRYGGSVWANKPIVNYLFSGYRIVKKIFERRILKLRNMDIANVCLKIQNIYLKCWDPYSRVITYRHNRAVWYSIQRLTYFFTMYQLQYKCYEEGFLMFYALIKENAIYIFRTRNLKDRKMHSGGITDRYLPYGNWGGTTCSVSVIVTVRILTCAFFLIFIFYSSYFIKPCNFFHYGYILIYSRYVKAFYPIFNTISLEFCLLFKFLESVFGLLICLNICIFIYFYLFSFYYLYNNYRQIGIAKTWYGIISRLITVKYSVITMGCELLTLLTFIFFTMYTAVYGFIILTVTTEIF